ncbi:hypothetical protein [Ferrimonas marina]|uniref:Uncharacterized protein n=1 Tax=Ferrimonas marina TaxID=299255 RepID=A0A1M5TCQ0_9GAMM|nr:hypothetical protein [Ferrimonas marina]SHH48466.1 hypothetical protein SAMN02745129_2085 [Ferrimonas marina]
MIEKLESLTERLENVTVLLMARRHDCYGKKDAKVIAFTHREVQEHRESMMRYRNRLQSSTPQEEFPLPHEDRIALTDEMLAHIDKVENDFLPDIEAILADDPDPLL